MTTPPPPPGDWPPSAPAPAPAPAPSATPGRQRSWWTGGRILLAIVVVLVLMTLSAVGGFIAGSAWGAYDSLSEGFLEGIETEFDAPGSDVPGVVGLDEPAAAGEPLTRGSRVTGFIDDRPVEHPLTVESGDQLVVEVVASDLDTVLVLLDGSGEVVASDDDGGEGMLSRLEVAVGPGTYTVRVQPWLTESGAYELVVD